MITQSFDKLAREVAIKAGHPSVFIFSVGVIFIWILTGPFFYFSNTWQLIINSATTIVTFLMVFLIQSSQNRDTLAVQLKLDEIIRAMSGSHHQMLDIETLSEKELEELHKRYESLAHQRKKNIRKIVQAQLRG